MINTFKRVLEGVFKPAINLPGTKFSRAKEASLDIDEKEVVEAVRKKRMEMESGGKAVEKGGSTLPSNLVAAMIQGELLVYPEFHLGALQVISEYKRGLKKDFWFGAITITEEAVIDNLTLLVFAAHDTTSFAITFKILAQLQNGTLAFSTVKQIVKMTRNKAPDESLTMEDTKKMKYTWQVAWESMLLLPPIFGSFRKAVPTDIRILRIHHPQRMEGAVDDVRMGHITIQITSNILHYLIRAGLRTAGFLPTSFFPSDKGQGLVQVTNLQR
ncbi:hypothetical protein SLEP1_g27717 [Rubroshorea leprosula]|uniref:Uncharacterized protein n=1 Tax=Rubroshorea leprosula TaxID=152421 RepID=A0AAV5JWV9_9ROSI|nr:hypothetical protein SLEP1_g27717 [Rubroshorea leprosula]